MAKPEWSDPYRKKADPRAAANRHRHRLLAMSDVVSVGIGFDTSHRTVIVVGVTSAEAAADQVPADLDGVPVQVRVVGDLSTREGAPEGEAPPSGKK